MMDREFRKHITEKRLEAIRPEVVAEKKSLVGEICGSPIRSNEAPTARFAQPANPMWDRAASAFTCS
jgi:hypothetical protein